MRIAFIYDAVYPWVTGGAQKRVWELARRLTDDHEVHWYGQKYWQGENNIEKEGVQLHGVCQPKKLYTNDRRSISQALYFSANLFPALTGEEYDIIDCQEFPYFPCFISRITSLLQKGELFITWYEVWGEYWFDYLGKLGYIGKEVEKRVANLNATHIATSETTKQALTDLGTETVQISPLGIDFEKLESITPVDENIDILFGGRLIPEKNGQLFVESIDKIKAKDPDIKAVIIGEGPEREKIEQKISDLDLEDSVDIMDFVEHAKFLAYIKSANVFAFPSEREGFGLVGLEALATGTPIVTADHQQNAARELVEPGHTGYKCEVEVDDLAAKLLQAESIDSEACKQFAKTYDWDKIADKMENRYKAIVQ